MLSKQQKKDAASQFRERKSQLGVYRVRCAVTAEVWIGASRNLEAARNGIWFSLRLGAHRDKRLQDAWKAHGEPAFEYDILETLEEDAPALLIADLLKEKKQRWMAQFAARGLL